MADHVSTLQEKRAETFVVDRAWFKQEAREALKLYFAPFSGIYAAFRSDPAAK